MPTFDGRQAIQIARIEAFINAQIQLFEISIEATGAHALSAGDMRFV
jgi:hypothetical protein